MLTPDECDQMSEEVIVNYIGQCGCDDARDVAKALEKLLSKSAVGIEKYVGLHHAADVCVRTRANMIKNPQDPS